MEKFYKAFEFCFSILIIAMVVIMWSKLRRLENRMELLEAKQFTSIATNLKSGEVARIGELKSKIANLTAQLSRYPHLSGQDKLRLDQHIVMAKEEVSRLTPEKKKRYRFLAMNIYLKSMAQLLSSK